MLDRVGIKVKVKQVETAVLAETRAQGRVPGLHLFAGDRTRSAGGAEVLPLGDAAVGLQLHQLQERRVRQAAGRGRPDRRHAPSAIELLQKANALLFEEAPVWFFNYNKAVMAVQPWLKGIQLNATELTHQNVEDLWVDASSPAK